MAHLLPAPGNYPQFIGGGGFYGKFPTGQAQRKRKANKARTKTETPAGNVA